jgi:RHS repeat-associated protein
MEKDDEIKGGKGNSLDFGARMYDSRIGRWFKVDNESSKLPQLTPYGYVNNNPVRYIDPDGNFLIDVHRRIMRNAFSSSKKGRTLVFKNNRSSKMIYNPKLSKKVIHYREAIEGTNSNNRSAVNDYNGNVVAPDVRTLPKGVGGESKPSVPSEHFDSMSYDEIIINLSTIDNKILTQTTLYNDGKISARQLGNKVGEQFHAIQDLYSHSNYIELYKTIYGETDIATIPTIDEVQNSSEYNDFSELLKTSLKTGTYPGSGPDSHNSMNHDVGAGSNYWFVPEAFKKSKVTWNTKAAEAVATKASIQINDKIESNID